MTSDCSNNNKPRYEAIRSTSAINSGRIDGVTMSMVEWFSMMGKEMTRERERGEGGKGGGGDRD